MAFHDFTNYPFSRTLPPQRRDGPSYNHWPAAVLFVGSREVQVMDGLASTVATWF